jgi:hypothetical protein
LLHQETSYLMEEQPKRKRKKRLAPGWRTVVEVSFIVFLFYSNLLMGEFTRSKMGQNNGLLWAIGDIFTLTNFIIAVVLALIGQLVLESVRKRL